MEDLILLSQGAHMKSHTLKTLMVATVAAAMLGTGGIASASTGSPTCTLVATSTQSGHVVEYSGTVTLSPSSFKMDHFDLQVQGPTTGGKQIIYTSGTNLDKSVETFSNVPSHYTGSVTLSAHVYGPYVDGTRWTTDCKTTSIPTNDLPEVPWSAGLPLILGAGAIVAYRRRRTA
jgi:hypothetical protein